MAELPGNPSNALYNETLAGIQFAEESSLSGIKEGLTQAEAANTAAEGVQTKAEPGAFRSIDSRANSQGLLESGVETRRTGDQTATFASQRAQRQQALRQAREGAQRHTDEAKRKGEVERGVAAKKAEAENFTDITNNPQPAYTPGPSIPVPANTPIPGVAKPPPGPAPPGMEWTPSGGGGWVPKGTKVVRTYK